MIKPAISRITSQPEQLHASVAKAGRVVCLEAAQSITAAPSLGCAADDCVDGVTPQRRACRLLAS